MEQKLHCSRGIVPAHPAYTDARSRAVRQGTAHATAPFEARGIRVSSEASDEETRLYIIFQKQDICG